MSTILHIATVAAPLVGAAVVLHRDYVEKCDKAAADYYRRLRGER